MSRVMSGLGRGAVVAVPYVGLVIATSLTWPLVTLALRDNSVGSVSAVRVAFSAAGLWGIAAIRRRHDVEMDDHRFQLRGHDVIILAAIGVAGYTAFSSAAIARTGGANSLSYFDDGTCHHHGDRNKVWGPSIR